MSIFARESLACSVCVVIATTTTTTTTKGIALATLAQWYCTIVNVHVSSGLIITGHLEPAWSFAIRNPDLQTDAFLLSLCAVAGQVVIYHSIKTFGALFFATVMTTRQIVSMALSSYMYSNPLTYAQWFGAMVVFGALYYQSTTKASSHNTPRASEAKEQGRSDPKLTSVVVSKV
jgi:drug/metabolite transporter (DMT)-like permease